MHPTPAKNILSDFANNLVGGVWTFLASRRSLKYVKANFTQFMLLTTLAIASNVLYGWVDVGQSGSFNTQGIVLYLIWPFMALILGLFIAGRSYNPSVGSLTPVVMWLSCDLLITLGQTAIQYAWHQHWVPDTLFNPIGLLFFLASIWQAVGLLWIFAKYFHWPWWEQGLFLVTSFLALWVWLDNSQQQPIWQTKTNPLNLTPQPALIPVDVLYNQERLLRDELAQIQPSPNKAVSKPPLSDAHWYWLGVAGAGYQDVFKSEISKTRIAVEQLLGLGGSTAALINEQHSLESSPIASQTSIARTIDHIAKQMNPNSDVLVMHLSSHGKPGEIELANAPFKLQNLKADWLRQALDRAGIKWRIIIVSSCYSGSFINALQSPNTIVISASAADRASFGCTTGNHFSYFGEALYSSLNNLINHPIEGQANKALFVQLFEATRQSIYAREIKENKELSLPQIKIGNDIATHLLTLEQGLSKQATYINPNQQSALDLYMTTLKAAQ